MPKLNLISDLTQEFALGIINLYRTLVSQKEFIISKQLLRSGTSIGANVQEALAGVSRKDFVNKLGLASKEARETNYWLILLQRSQIVTFDYQPYIEKVESIINVLTKIVKTTQQTEQKL